MPKYRVTAPDGNSYEVTAPDGASQEEVMAYAKSNYKPKQIQQPQPKEQGMLASIGQGIGNAGAGLVRGAGSIGSTILSAGDLLTRLSPQGIQADLIRQASQGNKPSIGGVFSGVRETDTQRRQGMDSGLREMGAETDSMLYGGGKLAGEIAGTAGAGGALGNVLGRTALATKAPAVLDAIRTSGMTANGLTGLKSLVPRMIGGGITGGVAGGMIDPEIAGQSAAFGAALPVALMGAGKLGQSLRSAPQSNELAKKAINEYNIPLGVADITNNKLTKAGRSVLNDAPFIGNVGAKQKEAIQEAFNREVGRKFGAPEPKLTVSVVDAAKKRMGSEFDRIWNNNNLKVDFDLMQNLTSLEARAAKLPAGEGASLNAEIRDIYSKMVPDANGNTIIDGATANKFQSYLRRRAEGSAGLKNELGDLRQTIINSFNKSVSPDDAAALTLNRQQYKAFKTVEPLLNKGELGVAGREAGDIPASLLPSAVMKSYKSNPSTSPFADLSQIGSKFLADRVAQTGGSPRAMIQNSAIGSMLGLGSMSNPSILAALPAAYGTNVALGNPSLARMMVNRSGGLLSVNPALQQFGYQAMPALTNR